MSVQGTTRFALADALTRRRAEGLYRVRRIAGGPQGPEMLVDGQRLLTFCSNDYLGLAADPRVADAMRAGIDRYGVGAGAAHLINGHSHAHHALEEVLADFTGREAALLFSTGYLANLGVIGALAGRGDTVLEDRLNHASLIDGGLLSQARLRRYRHADPTHRGERLADAKGRRLVVTDGVFSMDGDIAPLAGLAERCARHEAWLMVDDAHGLGVIGPGGRGSVAAAGLDPDSVPILVGTLGKAFGTAGAFVAGSRALIETLIQQARSYVYTTALPPAVAEATRASVRLCREEPWRRDRLVELVGRLRRGIGGLGLPLLPSQTPIQPILLGETVEATRWSEALLRRGILVSAIRPPTVPKGRARLRITLSAVHTDAHIDALLAALDDIARGAAK